MKPLKIVFGILLLLIAVGGALWYVFADPPRLMSSPGVVSAYVCGGVTLSLIIGAVGMLVLHSAFTGNTTEAIEEIASQNRPPLPFPATSQDTAAWPAQMGLLATLVAVLISRAIVSLQEAGTLVSEAGSLVADGIMILLFFAGFFEGVRALTRWRSGSPRTRTLAILGSILNLYLFLLSLVGFWKDAH
jgi:hypothetical protein